MSVLSSLKGVTGVFKFGDKEEDKMKETAQTANDGVAEFKNKYMSAEAASDLLGDGSKQMESSQMGGGSVVNNNSRLKIYKPTQYDAVRNMGRDLREGKIVLLDLSGLDEKLTTKILQFMYGVCFAMDIEPEDVSKATKIISFDPQNVKAGMAKTAKRA